MSYTILVAIYMGDLQKLLCIHPYGYFQRHSTFFILVNVLISVLKPCMTLLVTLVQILFQQILMSTLSRSSPFLAMTFHPTDGHFSVILSAVYRVIQV